MTTTFNCARFIQMLHDLFMTDSMDMADMSVCMQALMQRYSVRFKPLKSYQQHIRRQVELSQPDSLKGVHNSEDYERALDQELMRDSNYAQTELFDTMPEYFEDRVNARNRQRFEVFAHDCQDCMDFSNACNPA